MIIQKISKNKIYLDNEVIDISRDIRLMYSLKEGMDISNIYEDIIKDSMRHKAIYILELRSRTEFEVRNKLKEKYLKRNYPIIEEVIEVLKSIDLIDDYDYAYTYINNNMGKGKNKVKRYLMLKGISSEILEDVFSEISDEFSNEERIKIEEFVNLNNKLDFEKMFRRLVSKGYSYSIVYDVMKTKLK